MARGDQLARQWTIIQSLLSSRTGKPISELAEALGCHRRTVYRDLEALQSAGFPLYSDQEEGRARWYLIESARRSIPVPFSMTELMALYFSRATIPWFRDGFSEQPRQQPEQFVYQRHLGIYGYRVSLLRRFVTWSPAPIEQVECLEQLRALYQGVKIHVEEVAEPPFAGVDTPADLEKIRQVIKDRGLI